MVRSFDGVEVDTLSGDMAYSGDDAARIGT
jgi:hypothetical protein